MYPARVKVRKQDYSVLAGKQKKSLGDLRIAIEYHENNLKIALKIDNRVWEGRPYGGLRNAYGSLGDLRKPIEYHEKDLKSATEIRDRAGVGEANGNLEIDDRAEEGRAHGNLGHAYRSLGDFQKAIEYHKKHMKIAKGVGGEAGEGGANENLEIGDRAGVGGAYGSLGIAYFSLGDIRKAIEYHEKHLKIALKVHDRPGEGGAYGNLGIAYRSLGDIRKAIEYHEKVLKIAIQSGDRAGEGTAYGNPGSAYRSLSDFQKTIEYHEKHSKITIEIGCRAGEGGANGNLDIGDRAGEGRAYRSLGNAYDSLGDVRKGVEYHEKDLKTAIEIGDRVGEGRSYHNIGNGYSRLGESEIAVCNFVSAVNVYNTMRSLLKSEGNWKMKFHDLHEMTYTSLWRLLLRIRKINEALVAADQGRAQTLYDNLLTQYEHASPASSCATFYSMETTICLFTELSPQMIFLGLEGLTINNWFLSREKKVAFRQGMVEADITEKDPIRALLQGALKKMEAEVKVRCGDRTFDRSHNECPSTRKLCEGVEKSCHSSDNPFRPFYDAVIAPIVDLLGSKFNELGIVSDGALIVIPWATIVESVKIRTVPSLTIYKVISSVPEGHHKKTGALLVGNPCLNELEKPLPDLPCAQEEVEMIASILNTRHLTRRDAAKAEVLKRMSSVGLIHIAAHRNKRTGEIALSPNLGWTSKFPQQKDFILKLSDVQAANLRARLVVLSCCHSGRGRILKGEGVVGIARAFLAAGARSVLISLWAIDDEATMVFMKSFHQRLKEGKTARLSAAVHQTMKSLHESEKFSKMRYWAPFQLIGD
ncbi:tetratricopeptide repeat protein 28-like [Acropora muricata]|uniref:tetratricopeptide repeat protein 28-like n=1 Tax=Acropora muricata TaxID=159855 RepID=UPI0034E43537